jgi:hypothetical protein
MAKINVIGAFIGLGVAIIGVIILIIGGKKWKNTQERKW